MGPVGFNIKFVPLVGYRIHNLKPLYVILYAGRGVLRLLIVDLKFVTKFWRWVGLAFDRASQKDPAVSLGNVAELTTELKVSVFIAASQSAVFSGIRHNRAVHNAPLGFSHGRPTFQCASIEQKSPAVIFFGWSQ